MSNSSLLEVMADGIGELTPSGKGQMPVELARIFMPLHDEMAKRTSGELPAYYDNSNNPEWSTAQRFRTDGYDAGWLRFDKVDIYGNDLS